MNIIMAQKRTLDAAEATVLVIASSGVVIKGEIVDEGVAVVSTKARLSRRMQNRSENCVRRYA